MHDEDVVSLSTESPEEANVAQAKIKRNRGSLGSGFAFLFSGYPGAGKTTAAAQALTFIEDNTDREVCHADIDAMVGDQTEMRADAEALVGAVADEYPIAECGAAVVDAVHSMAEIVNLSQYFERLGIIFIEANALARHNRLIEAERAEANSNMEAVSKESLKALDSEYEAIGEFEMKHYEFYDTVVENVALEKSVFEKYARYAARDLWNDYLYRD